MYSENGNDEKIVMNRKKRREKHMNSHGKKTSHGDRTCDLTFKHYVPRSFDHREKTQIYRISSFLLFLLEI